MKLIKILIIDNEDSVVKVISEKLSEKFESQVDIYPKIFNSSVEDYNSCNFLIDNVVNKSNWDRIYESYKEIDVFIIDQCLLTDSGDDLGLQFVEYITKRDYGKRIHIISGNDLSNNKLLKNKNIRFTGKFTDDYQTELALKIADREKLSINKTKEDEEEAKFIEFTKKIKKFKKKMIIYIDLIISFSFFVSIITTTLILFGKLIYSFIKTLFGKNVKAKTTEILEHSEHIFLYLIPLFILFGFYIYYRNNIRNTFLGSVFYDDGKTNTEEISKKTIKYTKLMFVSSIVSFIIVKIIEFSTSGEEYETKNIVVLISLLILLMTYYLILEKKEGKH